MCRNPLSLLILPTLALCATYARADLLLEPLDLKPGNQYRLVFVTSSAVTAVSDDIAEYNQFVQAVVDASPLASLGQTWTAIGSTLTVDARDNTHSNLAVDGVGVPIYSIDGNRVASKYRDFWDGSLLAPIHQTELDTTYDGIVWTGTNFNGEKTAQAELGAISGNTEIGYTGSSIAPWITNTARDHTLGSAFPMYAMSSVITISGELQDLAADFDDSGTVDSFDFLLWQRGMSDEPLSNDDLNLWETQYGEALPELVRTAIPEPRSIGLAAAVLLLSITCRYGRFKWPMLAE